MKPRVRKTVFELPPLELECMKALWAQGEASVQEIRTQINGANGRALAYTTIETIMDRLARKGAVARRKVGRAHRYTAQYQAANARADAVGSVVHHFFGGSRRALSAYLAGEPVAEPALRPAPSAVSPAQAASSRRPAAVPRKSAPAPKPQPSRPARSIDTSLL